MKTKAQLKMVTRGRHTKSLEEWSKLIEAQSGIPAKTIQYRILTLGWDIERAFTTPKKQINYNPVRHPRAKKKLIDTVMRKREVCISRGKVQKKSKFEVIEWRGQTKSLYEWAIEIAPVLNLKPDTIERRVFRGWDVEKAFTTPSQRV